MAASEARGPSQPLAAVACVAVVLAVAAWTVGPGAASLPRHAVESPADGSARTLSPAQSAAYVRSAFEDFLGRAPTAGELDARVATLGDGSVANRTQVVDGLARSDEWVSAVVQGLYHDTLGRDGDAGGVAYWSGLVQAGVVSVAQVAAAFYASDEFFDWPAGGTDDTWVDALYDRILHRVADAAGHDYWVERAGALGRVTVAYAFFQSAESAHTRVAALYRSLLGRAPDRAGWDYWAVRVLSAGDLALAAGLAVSDEYVARAEARHPASSTTRESVATGGAQGDGASDWPALSADGRLLAFRSDADDLVADDTNGASDVFVRDLDSGATTRVSVATDGTQADADCYEPAISADGRYVAFVSMATNLVYGDTNGAFDVFVHDLDTGATTRVSVGTGGTQADGVPDTGDGSYTPSLSADGRYVAFDSVATDLVAGDTNTAADVFVHDRQTATTTRVSVATDGTQANAGARYATVSADGRYVVFDSLASTLAPGDTNAYADVFLRDRQAATTVRLSVATDGAQGERGSLAATMSADGRYVAFQSDATTLVPGDTNGRRDVFVRDVQSGTTSRVSLASDGGQGDGYATSPALSADGHHVAFVSGSTNLVVGPTPPGGQVYLRDLGLGATALISTSAGGTPADQLVPGVLAIAADGRRVAYGAAATNLVEGDTNGVSDVFLWDRAT